MATSTSLRHPKAPLFIGALGLLLALPSFALGFYADDQVLLAKLRGLWVLSSSPFDLYRFAPETPAEDAFVRAVGGQPWWSSSSLHIHFMRPLTSALFSLDYSLFGMHPAGYHVHSLLWLTLFFVVAHRLYKQILPERIAPFALLLLVLNDAHTFPAAWLSCRHMLAAAVPSFFAVWLHVRHEKEGYAPGRYLAPLALVIGLSASESAVGGAFYWIAFDLASNRALRDRIRSAAPALACLGAYLVFYKLAGYGVTGSGAYLSPMSDPLGFLRAAATRFPVLIGDSIAGVPSDLAGAFDSGPFVAVGLIAASAVVVLYLAVHGRLSGDERRTMAFLAMGASSSMIVNLGGFPGTRLLLFSSVGVAGVVAILLSKALSKDAPGVRALPRSIAYVLAGIHLFLSPISSVGMEVANARLARRIDGIAADIPIGPRPSRYIILAGSDPLGVVYPAAVFVLERPGAATAIHLLSMAHSDHRITRTGERSFRLEPISGFLKQPFESLFRSPHEAFHGGEMFKLNVGTVKVAKVDDGLPQAIDVELDTDFDDPDLVLLEWRDGALRRAEMPPVGQMRMLLWSPGPTNMF